MTESVNQEVYRTEKLTFAAYLIASGKAQLVGTEPHETGRNVIFLLSPEPDDEDVTGFFSGNAGVSALRYSEAMNTLKSVVYEGRCQRGRL